MEVTSRQAANRLLPLSWPCTWIGTTSHMPDPGGRERIAYGATCRVTHLGNCGLSREEREKVARRRSEEKKAYEQYCHIATPETEFNRPVTQTSYRRTRRQVNQVPSTEPKFDPYLNDPWTRRHAALARFVQAARKVVIQLRCQARLERLKRLVGDIRAGQTIRQSLANLNKDPDIVSIAPLLPRAPDHIDLSLFPGYKASSTKSLVTHSTTLDKQSAKTISSCVHKEIPFVELKVPQQYQLMGYLPQSVPAYGSYTQPGLPRPLRSGAEEEYNSLDLIPGVDSIFLTPLTTFTSPTPHTTNLPSSDNEPVSQTTVETDAVRCEGSMNVEDIEGGCGGALEELPLTPPQSLFRRDPIHPLQLLNPCPGVASYVPMMDNSVVTFDHVLKPLPAFPTAKHPQVRLDPMDVIPEVMQWKQFPNHYLIANENHRRLASVWKPRWSDPFSSDLLPAQANGASELQLLTGPQPDDYVDPECEGTLPVPTMEMVRAQFNLDEGQATTEATDSRLRALSQLADEKKEKFDLLGRKIRHKFRTFQELLTDTKHSSADTGLS